MRRPKILLADDNSEMRLVLFDMLAENYDVSTVCTGKELYTLMSERRDMYDLVICDIVMPNWNGDEAVKMASAFGAHIPVIYISGDKEAHEVESSSSTCFLKKPISRNVLLDAVRSAMILNKS